MNVKEISSKVDELKGRQPKCVANVEKRILYSDSELLIIAIEKLIAKNGESAELTKFKEELAVLSESIKLGFVKRSSNFLLKLIDNIDQIVRVVGVWLILATGSVILAIPCIVLTPIDFLLVSCGLMSVYHQLSIFAKLFLARTILRVSAIFVKVEGLDRKDFGKECVLACFSHASSMDAFLLTATIPVTALTVVSD